jgi:hypothetical protein
MLELLTYLTYVTSMGPETTHKRLTLRMDEELFDHVEVWRLSRVLTDAAMISRNEAICDLIRAGLLWTNPTTIESAEFVSAELAKRAETKRKKAIESLRAKREHNEGKTPSSFVEQIRAVRNITPSSSPLLEAANKKANNT